MTRFLVYSFREENKFHPFYIGKGRPERMAEHFEAARLKGTTRLYYTLRSLLAKDIKINVEIIQSDLTEQEAFDLEKDQIHYWGRLDRDTGCLCNHTDGGDGCSGRNGECSLDQRIKLSKSQTPESRRHIKQGHKSFGILVEAYNLLTGETIKQYSAIRDVVLDGFDRRNVKAVLNGTNKSHGHRGWRYA